MLTIAAVLPGPRAQGTAAIRVAFYNIRSGQGVPALPGRPVLFAGGANCTDRSKPVNAWGAGVVQKTLASALNDDPSIVALGLAEAWKAVCASPERVRGVLGWKAASDSQNGVALVARYGFKDERWQQLDTSKNKSPSDTAWVLRAAICADPPCHRRLLSYVAHWYATGASQQSTYAIQARQTLDFMQATSSGRPHVLLGDLNVWTAAGAVCRQTPNGAQALDVLSRARYIDAWRTLAWGGGRLHGHAEPHRLRRARRRRLEACRLRLVVGQLPAARHHTLRARDARRGSAIRSLRDHRQLSVGSSAELTDHARAASALSPLATACGEVPTSSGSDEARRGVDSSVRVAVRDHQPFENCGTRGQIVDALVRLEHERRAHGRRFRDDARHVGFRQVVQRTEGRDHIEAAKVAREKQPHVAVQDIHRVRTHVAPREHACVEARELRDLRRAFDRDDLGCAGSKHHQRHRSVIRPKIEDAFARHDRTHDLAVEKIPPAGPAVGGGDLPNRQPAAKIDRRVVSIARRDVGLEPSKGASLSVSVSSDRPKRPLKARRSASRSARNQALVLA